MLMVRKKSIIQSHNGTETFGETLVESFGVLQEEETSVGREEDMLEEWNQEEDIET